jgi:hypothetical protein
MTKLQVIKQDMLTKVLRNQVADERVLCAFVIGTSCQRCCRDVARTLLRTARWILGFSYPLVLAGVAAAAVVVVAAAFPYRCRCETRRARPPRWSEVEEAARGPRWHCSKCGANVDLYTEDDMRGATACAAAPPRSPPQPAYPASSGARSRIAGGGMMMTKAIDEQGLVFAHVQSRSVCQSL